MSNNPEDYHEGLTVRFVQKGQTNFGEVIEVVELDRGGHAVKVEWDDDAETVTRIDSPGLDIPGVIEDDS